MVFSPRQRRFEFGRGFQPTAVREQTGVASPMPEFDRR